MSKKAGHDSVIIAEYRLLNAIANNPEHLADSRISADLFKHETAKSVYEAMQIMVRNDIPITRAALHQAATEVDFNVTAGVIDSIYQIDDKEPATITDIIKTLQVANTRDQVSAKAREILKLADNAGEIETDDILEKMFEIDTILKTGGGKSLLKDFTQWAKGYIEDLKERASGRKYSYGDDLLDKYLVKGAYPGAITTIMAATGQGKSTYALNLIDNCISLKIPCLYISLEMDGIDTFDRLISKRRDIPLEALYAGDSSLFSVIEAVEEEIKDEADNKLFYFVEEPNLSLAKVNSIVKEFQQRARTKYCIVFIDLATQLQDFMNTKGSNSVANSMEKAMNVQNAMAKSLGVHFVNIVQTRRDSDNVKLQSLDDLDSVRPSLGDVKNSGALVERSRVLLSCFRKRYYIDRYLQDADGADEVEDIMEVQILKNSSGPAGPIMSYMFEGEYFKMYPVLQTADIDLMKKAESIIQY